MSPKSTHQKQLERARAKREAARRSVVRRERLRRALIGGLAVVVLGGIAVPIVNFIRRPDAPVVDASPSASPTASESEAIACGGTRPPAADEPKPTYTAPPQLALDPDTNYQARVVTSCGEFVVELFAAESPQTANNFAFLAREGFYDGLTFHRVEPAPPAPNRISVIQGGDPDGTGGGGPGYSLPDELDAAVARGYPAGTVAMARADVVSGSQFFVTVTDADAVLQPSYPVFGEVVEGMDVVQTIASLPTTTGPSGLSAPDETVYIESITILEVPAGTPSDGGSPT